MRKEIERIINSTDLMMKLNADCILLKRILEKRLAQHRGDLNEIEDVKKSVTGSDQLLVQTYANRVREMRSGVEIND